MIFEITYCYAKTWLTIYGEYDKILQYHKFNFNMKAYKKNAGCLIT